MLLLWAAGATKGSFAAFLATLLCAAITTAWLAGRTALGKDLLRGGRSVIVVVLAAAVPVVFDPHSGDVFNLPKYTLVVIGALVLLGLWVTASIHYRAAPRWRNGLHWLVGALVAWTVISAIAGVDVHVSLLGNYGSYDGLFSAAAFGVIMMTAAEALDVADVRRALAAIAFAGGVVVVFYGLVQLHDSEVHGHPWDFITWHLGSFSNDIFSTFGNPNHLGGFIAMALPMVLVIGLGAPRWPWKLLTGALTMVMMAELLRTGARGAWVGAVVALVTTAIFFAPEVRHRRGLMIGGGAGVLCAAVVVGVVFGRRYLGEPLSKLFQTGGSSPVEQRFEIWRAALRIAVNHPVTGTGPDTFALIYPRYQSATWVKDFGATYLVNGAHDIFMNVLADQGFVGLLLFLALLLFIALRATATWRRSRAVERDENAAATSRDDARAIRHLSAAVTAAIVAYVVQAMFNVQQVGLSFAFWLLVGMLAALATAAGVPATLRPAALLFDRAVPDEHEPARPIRPAGKTAGTPRPAVSPPRGRQGLVVKWQTVVATAVVTVVVALLSVEADLPWRADHDYWAAALLARPGSSSAPTLLGPEFFAVIHKAQSLNPWEPSYPAYEATIYSNVSGNASKTSQAISDLTQSRHYLAKSVAEGPLWGPYPSSEADVDLALAGVQSADAVNDLTAAEALARQAIRDDPRDSSYRSLLSKIVAALKAPAAAKSKTGAS